MEASQKSRIIDLIQAICTIVQEDGYVNKTKLIKYLYLIDIEYYKVNQETYTGFNWIFHLYGPWTNEYEEIYNEMCDSPLFYINQPERLDYNTQFIKTNVRKDIDTLFHRPAMLSIKIRRILERWSSESISPMLDYVYFHTEPMTDALKNEPLDFSKISTLSKIPKFKLEKSSLSDKALKTLKERVKEKIKQHKLSKKSDDGIFTPPRYDEMYFRNMEILNSNDDY